MNILLDQVVHDHKNRGNNSLLEVALGRFVKYWPNAKFDVISIAPHFCKVYIIGAQPVDAIHFQPMTSKLDFLQNRLPKFLWRMVFELRATMSNFRAAYNPRKHENISEPGDNSPNDYKSIEKTVEAIEHPAEITSNGHSLAERYKGIAKYDLYVATGGGYMCDSDKRFLFPLFDRLEAAIIHGVQTFLVGQGVGPLEDPDLIRRARQVLPRVDAILVREENLTRPLLASLNVPSQKVFMTGDDAIEPAYFARREKLGEGIGLSLRVAAYTDVNRAEIAAIRPVIQHAANKYQASLISAPIDSNDADKSYIKELMNGYHNRSSTWKSFESSSEIIKRIGHCRIMISGTFHGAVFAISQGIPVIALTKSIEYQNKISGLRGEFGAEGCQIVNLKDENFEDNLINAIDFAWSSAERLRPNLLAEAERQISLGHAAYHKIFSLVEANKIGSKTIN